MLRYHCLQGLPTWIYDELQCIQDVAHRYNDEQSPEDLVETFAEELAPENNLPPERLLDGYSLLFEYDPAAIKVRNIFRRLPITYATVLNSPLLIFSRILSITALHPLMRV
jgi:secreted Zn-dependent insulinase-like peptidase